jgi:hypothetical protein
MVRLLHTPKRRKKMKKKRKPAAPAVDVHAGAVSRRNMGYVESVIADLQAGKTVFNYKEGGKSMEPKIMDGQLQTLIPIPDLSQIKKKDIVLCKVHGNIYTHLVKATRRNGNRWEFLIGNNHGHINGWTSLVYGKSVARYWERKQV